MKVSMCVGVLIADRSADLIIGEGGSSVVDTMCVN